MRFQCVLDPFYLFEIKREEVKANHEKKDGHLLKFDEKVRKFPQSETSLFVLWWRDKLSFTGPPV